MSSSDLYRILEAIDTLRDFIDAAEESVFRSEGEYVIASDFRDDLDVLADAIESA